jgi:N-glycosylase/DNA lyase
MSIEELKSIHEKIKDVIEKRKLEFKDNWEQGEGIIRALLLFSICTPQSSATRSWEALKKLIPHFLELSEEEIADILGKSGVRFKYNKARYMIDAREKLFDISVKDYIGKLISLGSTSARNEIAKTVKGIGMKEASHFLRNIGWGEEICILDRHILRNLVYYNIIEENVKLTTKNYLLIEDKMKRFANSIKIPVFDLDFVFWFKANGNLPVY